MDNFLTSVPSVQAFEKASGKTVNHKIVPRRGGDSTAVYAATETAVKELGWKSKLDVNDMCRDQWAWATVRFCPPLSMAFSCLSIYDTLCASWTSMQ